jgi:hypothetical protein
MHRVTQNKHQETEQKSVPKGDFYRTERTIIGLDFCARLDV